MFKNEIIFFNRGINCCIDYYLIDLSHHIFRVYALIINIKQKRSGNPLLFLISQKNKSTSNPPN